MSVTDYKILLKGKGHHDEGRAGGDVSPGEAVRLAADGKYDRESLAPGVAPDRGIIVAQEDALQGRTIIQDYALDDVIFLYVPLPGDHLNLLVKSGEDIDVGDFLSVEGSGSGLFIESASGQVQVHGIPVTKAKIWDALATDSPAAATADDMGLVTGTPGTDAPTLQGVDFGGTATDEKVGFELILPETYRAGAPVTIRALAAILTTLADVGLTLDCEVWKDLGTGLVSADLQTIAAIDINFLAPVTCDFVVTPTGFVAGDKLLVVFTLAGSDSGNLGVMAGVINKLDLLAGNASAGQFVALEDSGGALGANTHLTCRKL